MSVRTKGPRLYQTTKKASRSVAEIMGLLSEFGAESYHVQQRDGQPHAIAFVLRGVVYQLVPNVDGLERRLRESKTTARVDVQAVAWAQLRNLLELQLEAVESGIVSPETAFGGSALTSGGRTVGVMLEERRHELMPGESRLLPPGSAPT